VRNRNLFFISAQIINGMLANFYTSKDLIIRVGGWLSWKAYFSHSEKLNISLENRKQGLATSPCFRFWLFNCHTQVQKVLVSVYCFWAKRKTFSFTYCIY